MCFGSKKSSAPPPAPTAPTTAQNAVPDVSNQQKMAAITSSQSATQAPLGAELGAGDGAMRNGAPGFYGDRNYGAGGA